MIGRPYNEETLAKIAAIIVFVGFNPTFFPQSVLGFLDAAATTSIRTSSQVLNVFLDGGRTILSIGYLPVLYLCGRCARAEGGG